MIRHAWVARLVAVAGLLASAPLLEGVAANAPHRWAHGASEQTHDVFGIETGMTLAEVRLALAKRFPSAFSGCMTQIESPQPLLCRITPEAFYEEAIGRALSAAAVVDGPYISNLVLTVTESDAKRSIEVFFSSATSGRQAYRISATTHYAPQSQPLIATFQAAFSAKYGPLEPPVARGRGTVAAAYYADGIRVSPIATSEEAPDVPASACQGLAAAAAQLHDMYAMAERGFGRRLTARPCDLTIVLSMAPGTLAANLGVSTVVVFDAARLSRLLEQESSAAAALAALHGQTTPARRRSKDF